MLISQNFAPPMLFDLVRAQDSEIILLLCLLSLLLGLMYAIQKRVSKSPRHDPIDKRYNLSYGESLPVPRSLPLGNHA